MKYLQLHKKLLKEGLCEKTSGFDGGLCAHLCDDSKFKALFTPSSVDGDELKYPVAYWAYNGVSDPEGLIAGDRSPVRWEYTPLRQNIVLLMAAMNNEL